MASNASGNSIYDPLFVGSVLLSDEGLNVTNNRSGTVSNETETIGTTPAYILTWVTIANILVFGVGVLGNILVIVVVTRVKEMKTATNFCLMNLSIADLLVLFICQPAAMLEFYGHEKWLLGGFMCKLVAFLENMVTHASIMIIIAVSIGRYCAVCHPLRTYSTGSKSKAIILMVSLWVIVIGVTSPFLVIAQTQTTWHYIDKEFVDICISPITKPWHVAYTIIIFCGFFVIPLGLLIYLYTVIIYKVVKDTMSGQSNDSSKMQTNNSRKQVVLMLIGIIILFFVCLVPFRVIVLWDILASESESPEALGMEPYLNLMSFVRLLIYINSAGNPIIYNIYSTKFRKAFKKSLGCIDGNDVNSAMRRATVTNYSYVRSDCHIDSV